MDVENYFEKSAHLLSAIPLTQWSLFHSMRFILLHYSRSPGESDPASFLINLPLFIKVYENFPPLASLVI